MPAEGNQPPAPPTHPLPFCLLPTHETAWDPSTANVTLNVRLDGCIVPSEASAEGARIAYSHAVVIDDFIDDATRRELLRFLLWGKGGSGACDAQQQTQQQPTQQQQQQQQQAEQEQQQPQDVAEAVLALEDPCGQLQLPSARWERRTTDMAGAAPTWGVRQHVLQELAAGKLPALQEVGARLAKLYPEAEVAHLPSDAIQLQQLPALQEQQQQAEQPQQAEEQQGELLEGDAQPPPTKRSRPGSGGGGGSGSGGGSGAADAEPNGSCDGAGAEGAAGSSGAAPPVDCACFVANAAVAGDSFRYHVDADPTSFPDGSPWHAAYGDYWNGEPGRPLLVSLLLYLNEEWQREWGADTLFLDGATDTGVFVAPRPCRAVLFDQDIMHRVSAPLPAAGPRPRFSLVWKLALLPRAPGQALCVARREWGPPTSFGSAARVDAVKRHLAAERRGAAAAAPSYTSLPSSLV